MENQNIPNVLSKGDLHVLWKCNSRTMRLRLMEQFPNHFPTIASYNERRKWFGKIAKDICILNSITVESIAAARGIKK